MITKQRLEELIEQGATIWTVNGSGNINPVKTNKTCEIQRQYLMKEGQIYSYIEQTFETQEDAKWHKEFGNITRTERLELPTWEEFKKEEYFKFGNTEIFTCQGVLLIKTKKTSINDIVYDDLVFQKKFDKENYILACRKCKELFLGEQL